MGRAALKWSMADLAVAAGIGRITVARFEGGETVTDAIRAAITDAFETAGLRLGNRRGWVSVEAKDDG